MLTVIQENVTVGRDGLIELHARGLENNSKVSVVAVIEKEQDGIFQHSTKKRDISSFFQMAGHIDIDSDAVDSLREESLI